MKIRSGFVCHSMGDEHVVVAVGERTLEFQGMIRLNETGAFLWEHMQDGFTREQLCDELLKEYDVAADVALGAVESFIRKLSDAGVIEV